MKQLGYFVLTMGLVILYTANPILGYMLGGSWFCLVLLNLDEEFYQKRRRKNDRRGRSLF